MGDARRRVCLRLAVGLLLFATACANTETPRIWRISPLSEAEAPAEGRDEPRAAPATRERINLWPLAYRDGDALSILWPLFDLDDRGFALRPLISKEDSEWSVLYPWSSFDTETGRGWALPWYRTETSWGVFPLLHRGPLSIAGPIWWTEPHEQGRSYGLFPLAAKTRSLRHVGPVWWTPGWRSHGLLPLYSRGILDQIGPVWWQRDRDDDALMRVGLFPVGYLSSDGNELLVFPLYFHLLGPSSRERYYLLGLGHTYWEPERDGSWLLPLWWSRREEDRARRLLFPLFYYEADGSDRSLITPLGGCGWNTDGFTRYVNVLGPFYHSSRNPSGTRRLEAFLWPLIEYRRREDRAALRVLPVFWSTWTPEASDLSMLVGLAHASSSNEGRSFRLWPLTAWSSEPQRPDFLYGLTLHSHHAHGDQESSWLFPLFSTTRDGSDRSSWMFFLFGLARWRTSPTLTQWEVFPLVSRSVGGDRSPDYGFSMIGSESWEGGSRFELLWSAAFSYEHDRRPEREIPSSAQGPYIERWLWATLVESTFLERQLQRRWVEDELSVEEQRALEIWSPSLDDTPNAGQRDAERTRAILAEHGGVLPSAEGLVAETEETQKAVERFAQAHSEVITKHRVKVPLLYSYERDGEDVQWNLLFGTAYSTRSADRETLRVLYLAYHRERRGDRISRDVFPFVVWDSGPDEVLVSFLWRLFRYQRKGERRGGHVLFVGWGDLNLPPPDRPTP